MIVLLKGRGGKERGRNTGKGARERAHFHFYRSSLVGKPATAKSILSVSCRHLHISPNGSTDVAETVVGLHYGIKSRDLQHGLVG